MPDNTAGAAGGPARPAAAAPPATPSAVTVRPAVAADLPAINDVYNHYVLHSTATYQEEPEPMAARVAWFARHGPGHPVTVAVDAAGTFGPRDAVVGWASLSPYHPRSAYRFTVENSVYLRPYACGRGVGTTLLADLLARARAAGHRSVVALIDADQPASVALHRRFGFTDAGHLRQVGFKFGRWLDVVHMQLMLDEPMLDAGAESAPAPPDRAG
jgi:L-amino acid N-acyltransferase YncA